MTFGHCKKLLTTDAFRKVLQDQVRSLHSVIDVLGMGPQTEYHIAQLNYYEKKLQQIDRIRRKLEQKKQKTLAN